VNFVAQVARRQVGVAHHHPQALVAEQFRDGAKAHPGHDQPGGEIVPEVVPREIVDLGGPERGVERVLHVEHRLARVLGVPRVAEHVRTVEVGIA
jgi:hypothetical protein